MDVTHRPSVFVRFSSVAFFAVLAIAALTWFTSSISALISDILLNSPVVGFDKGSMYMFGAGLGAGVLTIVGVIQGLLGKKLTPKNETLFVRGLVISLVLMIGFPHLAHYLTANYVKNHNYVICSDATYRWLFYSKFYYAKNTSACNGF